MTLARRNKGRLWSYNKFVSFSCKIVELIITKYDLRGISKLWSTFFVFWIWRISFRFWQLTKKIEIWTQFLISPGILKVQTSRTHLFWICQGIRRICGYFSRIVHGKLGRRLNAKNKLKFQRRLQNRLATVIFRGTHCGWTA